MLTMGIKETLKQCLSENLQGKASEIFLKRANETIDSAIPSRDGYLSSVDKVSKLIRLFVDQKLAGIVREKLIKEIEKYHLS
jgi:hypothetical protein